MKIFKYLVSAALCAATLTGCTDLDETLYDQVGTQNYYNTKMDVVRATFRPFEHAFWSIQSRHVLNELSADQLITPTRDGWWDDGGKWRRLHYHEWNVEDGGDAQTEWNGCFQGIMQAIMSLKTLIRSRLRSSVSRRLSLTISRHSAGCCAHGFTSDCLMPSAMYHLLLATMTCR